MVFYVMVYSFIELFKDDDSDDFGEEVEEEEKFIIYMVLMVDMLNYIVNNNVYLFFKLDCLEMIVIKDIKKVYSVYIIRVYIIIWFFIICIRQYVVFYVILCL